MTTKDVHFETYHARKPTTWCYFENESVKKVGDNMWSLFRLETILFHWFGLPTYSTLPYLYLILTFLAIIYQRFPIHSASFQT